ncbi:MAG: hypothetical protein RLZ32_2452, partial [Gemmatimonadota bacterium]
MASVFQKQGKWWLKFKDAHGKWRIIPTTLDTKTGAVRLARDLEQKAERQRLGLEPMPVVENITFGELMNRWWGEHGPLLRSKTIQPFAKRHLEPVLGNKLLREISAGQLEILFNELRQSLSPQSCNHLRSYIRRAFAYASRRGLWRGDNPAAALKKQRIPKKKPEYLRPDEVAAVLERVPAKWQPLFATAFFTGMRKGELLGLKKADLDLRNGTITVRRSNNFDTTKGSHEDELPIANELRPFLVTALKASPPTSEFVFCRPDGRQYPADVQLQRVLRYAMGQAGIVIGYQHV